MRKSYFQAPSYLRFLHNKTNAKCIKISSATPCYANFLAGIKKKKKTKSYQATYLPAISKDFIAICKAPSREILPPINPVGCTNTQPGIPLLFDSSSPRRPRHDSGSGSLTTRIVETFFFPFEHTYKEYAQTNVIRQRTKAVILMRPSFKKESIRKYEGLVKDK